MFDIDENGNTTVKELAVITDNFDKVIQNVMIGSGVILICVTVSMVAAPSAPAVSLIFATAAKNATTFAISGAALDGVVSVAITGYETGDVDKAIQEGLVSASEGFKWGAIFGALEGGTSTAIKYNKVSKTLKGEKIKGLTLQEAAVIQTESGYPLSVIKKFNNFEQYKICKKANLKSIQLKNNRIVLSRKINLKQKDEFGRTNLERMKLGNAPLDKNGISYELHHVGQEVDSPLAILTKEEHIQNGNDKIWHPNQKNSDVHSNSNNWDTQRKNIWRELAEKYE